MQSTEIKTTHASCFFIAAYHFPCATLCARSCNHVCRSAAAQPEKRYCDLHGPKNNNINLAAELLQSGHLWTQHTARIRNPTAGIGVFLFLYQSGDFLSHLLQDEQ